jgi:hypothetical protein
MFTSPASRKGRITVKFIISVMATTLLVSCETVMNPIGKPAPTDAGPLPSDGRYTADSGAAIDGGMSDGGGGGIDDMTRLRMLGQRSDDTIQALKADALADTVEFNDAVAQFNAMVTPADLADILRLLKDLHSGAIPDRSAVDRLLARYSALAYFTQLATQSTQADAGGSILAGFGFETLEPSCDTSCFSQTILPTFVEFQLFAAQQVNDEIAELINFIELSTLLVQCLSDDAECNADAVTDQVLSLAVDMLQDAAKRSNALFAVTVSTIALAKFALELWDFLKTTYAESMEWIQICKEYQQNECPVTLTDGFFTWVCKNCYPLPDGTPGLGSMLRVHFQYEGWLDESSEFELRTTGTGPWEGSIILRAAELTEGYGAVQDGLYFGGPDSGETHQTKYLTFIAPNGTRSNTISVYVPREDAE